MKNHKKTIIESWINQIKNYKIHDKIFLKYLINFICNAITTYH